MNHIPGIEEDVKVVKVIEEKQEFKTLTEDCGHHCGAVASIGTNHVSEGHCKSCHASPDKNVCEKDKR